MTTKLKIAIGGLLLILGTIMQVYGQNLIQPLTVNLTAYDTVSNRTVKIGTSQLIQYLAGTNVNNGHLYLVTPTGNVPGSIGNLNSFLRITSGSNTVMEIPTTDQFNLYQDTATVRTSGMTVTSHALNRFSIDSGSVRAELQGISTWSSSLTPVNGTDVSGTGSFQSAVNGWITVTDVTQPVVPVSGTITASRPKPGP